MKFKITANREDWMKFGILALALLYIVAIIVLNIESMLSYTGSGSMFHGLNPFPAFSKENIGFTFVFYILAVGFVIYNVRESIFDFDSGFGFGRGRKRDGFSRWLTSSELKREKNIKAVSVSELEANAGGVPLINNGRKIWVDNGEGHTLIMGSSGSGKTQMIVVPMVKSLAKNNESMIINDPKGEIYEKTSKMLKERGYNVVVLNFRNPERGSGWNPLMLPYKYYKEGNGDKANELIDDLALNILYDENASKQDPFWEKTSADYFSGLALALFEDATEEEINLNSINLFTTVGEENCGPNKSYVQEYFNSKDPNSPAYVSASSTLIAPSDTKGSILSVFKQKLRLFASRENISEMLSHSDFDFDDIGSKKTAIFIIVHDEKTTYHSLVTIFVKQCYEALIDYAQKNHGKLPYRTNFILDEFANMPPLKDVSTMVTAARSRGMRFTFIIQNFAQLTEKYGEHVGNTIKGNAMNIIYLISTELAALEEISKMCGEIKVKNKDKDGKEKEENRPLVTVSDLQKMEMGEIILMRQRLDPYKGRLEYDWRMKWPDMYKTQESKDAVYPLREKSEVKVFDLKGFVQKKKEEKINQIIGGKGNISPSDRPSLPNFQGISNPSKPRNGGINVNDLIKKIDSRIAELEAEEAKEKERIKADRKMLRTSEKQAEKPELVTEKINPIPAVPSGKIELRSNDEKNKFAANITEKINSKIMEEKPQEMKKPDLMAPQSSFENSNIVPNNNISNNNQNIPVSDNKSVNNVTDDQFFDDFFSDD